MKRERVAAVVPHWNRRDLLETLLENLARQSRPFDEAIVADNGSTDDSAAVAERHGARVVRLGSNLGFAAAVNRGIEAADADWIAILNNDVTLDAKWLETLLEQAGDAWFATGKILSMRNPGVIDGTFDEISRGACAHRCGWGQPDGPVWSKPRAIRLAPMTAVLFRRGVFDRVGLLDERFRSYLEDVDFGIRCSVLGLSGVYVPDAVAYHLGSATQGAWNSDTVRAVSRNQMLLAAKHFRGMPRWPIVVGQLLWAVPALRHCRGIAWLRGKISGLQAARQVCGDPLDDQRDGFRKILEASERSIFEIQQQTGFDWYWRAYFWLLRR